MKRKQQTTHNGPGIDQEIDFNDWAIDRLYIEDGSRKDFVGTIINHFNLSSLNILIIYFIDL